MLELGAPVRVTWDLPGEVELAWILGQRLREARLLFLDVWARGRGKPALSVLSAVLAGGRGPRLTVTGGAEELEILRDVLGPGELGGVDLQLLPPFPSAERVTALAEGAHSLTPTLWCTPDGLRSFRPALELARACGLAAVALLNPPVSEPWPTPADRESVVAAWQESGLERKVELRVHDLFLSEVLGLDPFREYGGCQAGEYLSHVNARGELVACRTLPERLGDLVAEPLTTIWRAESRRAFRIRLRETPEACGRCAISVTCRGGCRGYAPNAGRDPSCPGEKGLIS